MVNISCLTQNQGKCILRYNCEELFGLYNWGGSYTYSTHSKFQCSKQLAKGVVVLQTYLTIPILELNSAQLQAMGVRESPQALVACLTYFWSHCRLKIVSPVGVILQLTVGKGGILTVDGLV